MILQDTGHPLPPPIVRAASGSESPLTRSLPRIWRTNGHSPGKKKNHNKKRKFREATFTPGKKIREEKEEEEMGRIWGWSWWDHRQWVMSVKGSFIGSAIDRVGYGLPPSHPPSATKATTPPVWKPKRFWESPSSNPHTHTTSKRTNKNRVINQSQTTSNSANAFFPISTKEKRRRGQCVSVWSDAEFLGSLRIFDVFMPRMRIGVVFMRVREQEAIEVCMKMMRACHLSLWGRLWCINQEWMNVRFFRPS